MAMSFRRKPMPSAWPGWKVEPVLASNRRRARERDQTREARDFGLTSRRNPGLSHQAGGSSGALAHPTASWFEFQAAMIDGAGKGKSGTGGDAVSAAAVRQNSPSVESVRALLASRQFETALELTDVGDMASLPAWLAVARARAFVGLARWQDAIAVARRFERDRLAPAQLLEVAAEAASGAADWETALAFLERALLSSNVPRSEEHTSELQSPDHLVCRLLLEKKKHSA